MTAANPERRIWRTAPRPRTEVPAADIDRLAAEFAAERLNGLPGGMAWFKAWQGRGRKLAARHGWSWAELYAQLHQAAYAIIDADPRSRLGG